VRIVRLFGEHSGNFPAQPFGAGRPADCGTVGGQTRQTGGADRLIARARLLGTAENGFFSAANFDKRAGADLTTATQTNFCSYSFSTRGAGNGTPTTKKGKKRGADLKNPRPIFNYTFLILLV